MSRPAVCRCGLRGLLKRIHPVDKSLLLFMLVLLAQSAYSIFFPGGAGQTAEDIDIIVRTSSAAIFGYFLSANFIRHADAAPSPDAAPAHILETGSGGPADPGAPAARIGFSLAGDGPESPGAPSGGADAPPAPASQNGAGCLQVAVATVIGLFCLVTLLALRNLSQWGLVPAASDSVAASVIQFRDFVSGCVGFLIGCPTHSSR